MNGPRKINYKEDTATEETILDLRLKRFGCSRIRFRLKRLGVYLSSRNETFDRLHGIERDDPRIRDVTLQRLLDNQIVIKDRDDVVFRHTSAIVNASTILFLD
jgi:hypothetical protein